MRGKSNSYRSGREKRDLNSQYDPHAKKIKKIPRAVLKKRWSLTNYEHYLGGPVQTKGQMSNNKNNSFQDIS